MKEIIFVGAGGFIGASIRYVVSSWFMQFSRMGFPLGTFSINLIGCTLLGILIGLSPLKNSVIPVKEFLAIGVLGGFTTFSAFGLESLEMIKAGQYKMTAIYILGSIILGLLGIFIGIILSRQIFHSA